MGGERDVWAGRRTQHRRCLPSAHACQPPRAAHLGAHAAAPHPPATWLRCRRGSARWISSRQSAAGRKASATSTQGRSLTWRGGERRVVSGQAQGARLGARGEAAGRDCSAHSLSGVAAQAGCRKETRHQQVSRRRAHASARAACPCPCCMPTHLHHRQAWRLVDQQPLQAPRQLAPPPAVPPPPPRQRRGWQRLLLELLRHRRQALGRRWGGRRRRYRCASARWRRRARWRRPRPRLPLQPQAFQLGLCFIALSRHAFQHLKYTVLASLLPCHAPADDAAQAAVDAVPRVGGSGGSGGGGGCRGQRRPWAALQLLLLHHQLPPGWLNLGQT